MSHACHVCNFMRASIMDFPETVCVCVWLIPAYIPTSAFASPTHNILWCVCVCYTMLYSSRLHTSLSWTILTWQIRLRTCHKKMWMCWIIPWNAMVPVYEYVTPLPYVYGKCDEVKGHYILNLNSPIILPYNMLLSSVMNDHLNVY